MHKTQKIVFKYINGPRKYQKVDSPANLLILVSNDKIHGNLKSFEKNLRAQVENRDVMYFHFVKSQLDYASS